MPLALARDAREAAESLSGWRLVRLRRRAALGCCPTLCIAARQDGAGFLHLYTTWNRDAGNREWAKASHGGTGLDTREIWCEQSPCRVPVQESRINHDSGCQIRLQTPSRVCLLVIQHTPTCTVSSELAQNPRTGCCWYFMFVRRQRCGDSHCHARKRANGTK